MCDGCEVNQKYYRYTITEPTKEDLLLDSLCIPTQAEVRSQLGSKLAEVFFENLSSEGRVILGLEPPLMGPDQLWVDPVSRLKNKVRCKPVPEPQVLHLKAFTHHAILEVGQHYMDLLQSRIEREIEEALLRQAEILEAECNKRIKEALEAARLEAEEQCKEVVGTMMEHFDRCFEEMIETYRLKMRKECQMRVKDERAEVVTIMMTQLQEEVEKRDLELCSDFHDTLFGELNALSRKFVKQIDAERKIAQEALEDLVQDYEKKLADLRAEMEISNLVDVCRAIYEERSKIGNESSGVEAAFKNQTDSLMKMIVALKARNKTLLQMSTGRAKRIKQYEKKMKQLVDEFQKFVNFALEAVPGQAEFLLTTQKMILSHHYEDNFLEPEEYEDYMNCLMNRAPPKTPSVESPCTARSPSEKVPSPPCREEDPYEKCMRETPCKYTFNYYKFKYMLLKRFIKGIRFGDGKKCPIRTKPCEKREKEEEEERKRKEKLKKEEEEEEQEEEDEVDREGLEEYKKSLKLVGENMREHLQPMKTFLRDRMMAVTEICKDDPELVRLMLCCPPPLREGSSGRGTPPRVRRCTTGRVSAPKVESPC